MSEEVDPFAHPPVYKYEQVVTEDNLISIYQGYLWQYNNCKWWQWDKKNKLTHAMRTTESILIWLNQGKDK